jgi:2-oxoglutarate dehydrogenase E2 component (dihydrolipoamide succinyltransferase)
MIIEVKIPGAGESITEVAIGNWLAENGALVEKDQEIAEVETDKATLPLIAPESGMLQILVNAGDKVQVGDVACTVDTDFAAKAPKKTASVKITDAPATMVAAPVTKVAAPLPVNSQVKVTPLANRIMEQHNLDIDAIINGLRKITRQEVEMVVQSKKTPDALPGYLSGGREAGRTPMSPLRRKLSKRLISVKNETAMLTTFNEVDMSNLMELRRKYQAMFQEKHGQKLSVIFHKGMCRSVAGVPKGKFND